MSKFNIKNYAIRIGFFLVGCFIIQLGVAFFIKSSTGVDSFTIFMQGLSNLLNIRQKRLPNIFVRLFKNLAAQS